MITPPRFIHDIERRIKPRSETKTLDARETIESERRNSVGGLI